MDDYHGGAVVVDLEYLVQGGGRLAFSSVRFAGVWAEGFSRNDSQLHNSALVRFAVKVSVMVDGAW